MEDYSTDLSEKIRASNGEIEQLASWPGERPLHTLNKCVAVQRLWA